MNKVFKGCIITLIIFLVGCNSSASIHSSDLDKYDVSRTSDETIQDDFIFRLVSEKEKYKKGEEVNLYGEIEYIGEKEEITILHSSSAIIFPIEEKIRDYDIEYLVEDKGLATTLKRGEPYQEKYKKSGGYSPSQDAKDYINFIDDFIKGDDFPIGFYVVNGFTDFFVDTKENEKDLKQFKIEATVDFKVGE